MRDRARLVQERRLRPRPPSRKLTRALSAGRLRLPRKLEKVMGRTAKSTGPRATISKSVIRLSSSSRGRGLNMRSVIRKKVRMAPAGRAEAVNQIAPPRLFRTKENPPGAKRRKFAMMRVMEGMKRKLASRSSRRPLMPCALTGVHPCTPLTANFNGGDVRSMPWSQR